MPVFGRGNARRWSDHKTVDSFEKTAVAMKPKPTPLGVGCYHHLDLFDTSEIQDLRQKIEGKKTPITYCPIRGKAVQLKPEELIRQLYVERLLNRYHYPRERLPTLVEKKNALTLLSLTRTEPIPPILSLK